MVVWLTSLWGSVASNMTNWLWPVSMTELPWKAVGTSGIRMSTSLRLSSVTGVLSLPIQVLLCAASVPSVNWMGVT